MEIVTLITADAIDENLRAEAERIASTIQPGSQIEFRQEYDPAIIGGFILKIGDLLYDASVRRKLSDLRKHLLES